MGPHGETRGPPGEITWAPRGNHVGPQGQLIGPPVEITWAARGNLVGPPWKSRGPPGEITWDPRGNHVGPQGQSRGPPVEITWAPRGNHEGLQAKIFNGSHCLHQKSEFPPITLTALHDFSHWESLHPTVYLGHLILSLTHLFTPAILSECRERRRLA